MLLLSHQGMNLVVLNILKVLHQKETYYTTLLHCVIRSVKVCQSILNTYHEPTVYKSACLKRLVKFNFEIVSIVCHLTCAYLVNTFSIYKHVTVTRI